MCNRKSIRNSFSHHERGYLDVWGGGRLREFKRRRYEMCQHTQRKIVSEKWDERTHEHTHTHTTQQSHKRTTLKLKRNKRKMWCTTVATKNEQSITHAHRDTLVKHFLYWGHLVTTNTHTHTLREKHWINTPERINAQCNNTRARIEAMDPRAKKGSYHRRENGKEEYEEEWEGQRWRRAKKNSEPATTVIKRNMFWKRCTVHHT